MNKVQPVSFKSHENGHSIGGISVSTLAKKYGTPLYIMDGQTIRKNCKSYTQTLRNVYKNNKVLYAGKANLSTKLINFLVEEQMGLDVVSGGELYTALNSHMKPENIYFHGNNKSKEELELALENNVRIIVDNLTELALIKTLTSAKRHAYILLRIKPEVDTNTHDFIKTGQLDSKFGIDKSDLQKALTMIQTYSFIHYVGIHSHIGSQILDSAPYTKLIQSMGELLIVIHKLGMITQELNIGGGFGIAYNNLDNPINISSLLTLIAEDITEFCKLNKIPLPTLLVEPGRSIVGNAGITAYTVGAIKEIPGIKSYVFVDGGMADNPRPLIYKSKHDFIIDAPSPNALTQPYTIAGKFCESGDILGEDIDLPTPKTGDHLIAFCTGAYNYSMSSNYNRFCKPSMIMVENGHANTWVKRETYEDVVRLDAK